VWVRVGGGCVGARVTLCLCVSVSLCLCVSVSLCFCAFSRATATECCSMCRSVSQCAAACCSEL